MSLLITLDMDGTMYDPWACCGRRDGYEGSPSCRHLRADTLAKVQNVRAVYPEARLVALSWRSGLVETTRRWLGHVGIAVDALYIPGSPDDVAGPFMAEARRRFPLPQVQFKAASLMALRAMGHEVIACFDDNADVLAAVADLGLAPVLSPRLVSVLPPRPAPRPDPLPTPIGLASRPRWRKALAELEDDWQAMFAMERTPA